MSMFAISFATDNAAFEEDKASETARILREIADKVEAGHESGKVFDGNGNSVGSFAVRA